MKNRICYIIGAGEHFDNDVFIPCENDLVIAADAGFAYLHEKQIKADIVVGDFDSLAVQPDHPNVIKLNPIKDETDTLSAIQIGIEKGYTCFHVYGGTGGRISHTIANIQNLAMLAEKGLQGYLFGHDEIMTVIHNDEIHFDSTAKGFISAFSLNNESTGVYEKNLKYTLDNYTMKNNYPIGVSNEFIGKESCIKVEKGTLLIVYSKGTKVPSLENQRPVLRGIKAAIFDLDGTILDSMDVWSNIDNHFLQKRGFAVPDDYMNKIGAMSFREAADYTIERFNLVEKPENIMDEWNEMAIDEYSHNVKLLPYTRDYLLELKAKGIKLAVATGSLKELYEPALINNGIYDLFDVICSANDVGCGKESPRLFNLAIKRLGMKSPDCIIFDDVLAAIKSAKTTGAVVYGVYNKYSEGSKDEIRSISDGYLFDFKHAPILL